MRRVLAKVLDPVEDLEIPSSAYEAIHYYCKKGGLNKDAGEPFFTSKDDMYHNRFDELLKETEDLLQGRVTPLTYMSNRLNWEYSARQV